MIYPCTEIATAENASPVYVVNANTAKVYQSPDFSSEVLQTLSYGTQISLEIAENLPVTYIYEGFSFYKVLEDFEGYIFADLVSLQTQTITSIPNYNGRTNNECSVFFLNENEMQESDITLTKNQRIFIYKAFDSKAEYTAVAFEHENAVVYGYVLTKYVAPDGINPIIITCVVIILAILGIIFAWLFMKNSKVKKINGTKN